MIFSRWFKKVDESGLCCKSVVCGEVGIVVTRNKGLPDEYTEEYGTHKVYRTDRTLLGKLVDFINTLTRTK